MKILIAAGIYPPDAGGPALHAQAQAEGLPQFGIETVVVALAHFRQHPFGLRHFLYFRALMRQVEACDVVYAHDALGAGLPALLAAKLYGKKFVVRVGGDLAWEREAETMHLSMNEWYESGKYHHKLTFLLSRLVLTRAHRGIVPSPLLTDLYARYYSVRQENLLLISNPLPEKVEYVEKGERTILFASRLVAYKNLDLVLKALTYIFVQEPTLKFVIIGDGPEREKLETLAKTLGIDKHILFKGRLSQGAVMGETAKCLFTIAPALTEFNPNYLLQGLAYGKPFLISHEHGLPFEVPGELIFNTRDEHDLQEKLLSLLSERGYLRAKQFVGSLTFHMSWQENLKANAEALESLFHGSK
jgi:glycosyltransferase involved in cell wall biosynthesis